MKKILTLLLATLMLLCLLAGCGNNYNTGVIPTTAPTGSGDPNGSGNPNDSGDPNDPDGPKLPATGLTEELLLGKWDVIMKATDEMLGAEDLPVFMQGMDLELSVKAVYEFKEGGVLEASIHKDDVEALFDDLFDDLEDHLKDGAIYDIYAEQGMSKESLNEMLEQANMTIDDLVDQIMVMVEPMLDEAMESFPADAEGYMREEGTYALNGNILTITQEGTDAEKITCAFDGKNTITMSSDGVHNGMVMVKQDTEA